VGNLYEYFAARSDDHAVAATLASGGPVEVGGWDAIDGPGIEPSINLADLEQVLTGASWDQVVDNPRASKTISANEHGFVVSLTDRLLAALAALPADRIPEVAGEWSHAEEFAGEVSPGDLAEFLTALRLLVQRADARAERVYCWVSL
jgi:hypothetical protein